MIPALSSSASQACCSLKIGVTDYFRLSPLLLVGSNSRFIEALNVKCIALKKKSTHYRGAFKWSFAYLREHEVVNFLLKPVDILSLIPLLPATNKKFASIVCNGRVAPVRSARHSSRGAFYGPLCLAAMNYGCGNARGVPRIPGDSDVLFSPTWWTGGRQNCFSSLTGQTLTSREMRGLPPPPEDP